MERMDFTQAREGKSRDMIIDFRHTGDLSPFCSKVSSSLGNCQEIIGLNCSKKDEVRQFKSYITEIIAKTAWEKCGNLC